jgi:16S rRNA (guanine966-N2)-methyltransferase
MAREGLFASLGSQVAGARCLDLFAGTGAVGIEALSRGASHCTFVDRSGAAVAAIRSNLIKTRLDAAAVVRAAAARGYLRARSGREEPFDLVFLDPPYELGSPYLDDCLDALSPGWLSPEGWTVVLTRGHRSAQPGLPLHWVARRQLRYGDSLLTLYQEELWG